MKTVNKPKRVVCPGILATGPLLIFWFFIPSLVAQQPIFKSDIITANTPGHQVAIDVDITGATDLYLVVDSVDGFSFDWCDWLNPGLSNAAGDRQKLTELRWQSASSSWGNVNTSKNCAGAPLCVDGRTYADGFGTHSTLR